MHVRGGRRAGLMRPWSPARQRVPCAAGDLSISIPAGCDAMVPRKHELACASSAWDVHFRTVMSAQSQMPLRRRCAAANNASQPPIRSIAPPDLVLVPPSVACEEFGNRVCSRIDILHRRLTLLLSSNPESISPFRIQVLNCECPL
jgi:hypothetical protein